MELASKLGLKPGMRAFVVHAPTDYARLVSLPKFVDAPQDLPGSVDWLQAFYQNKQDLAGQLPQLVSSLSKSGQLWLAWPKKSSGLQSDLSDDIIRKLGLEAGLVDVKIASINAVWAALKFVYRLADR